MAGIAVAAVAGIAVAVVVVGIAGIVVAVVTDTGIEKKYRIFIRINTLKNFSSSYGKCTSISYCYTSKYLPADTSISSLVFML